MPVSRLLKLASMFPAMLVVILAASAVPVRGQTADPSVLDQISSKRYIVIDDQTGEVFAEKDADVRGGMASVTKVFTAIVALEHAPLDMQITADDSDEFDSTSTRMTGLAPGVTFTVRDLLYGMMLESGNDAAHALARGIAQQQGDSDEEAVNRFVGWMNDKVAELGLKDTHFVNPHGLSDPDHYSTPRDIATFMMYAVQNGDFKAIITKRTYTTTTGATITSVNRGPEFIPDYIGGKTGYDEATGYCLVEIGKRGDTELVSVTIDGVAPDVWYQDHAILEQYAFAAHADRVAAGKPIGDNVLAYVQQTTDEPPPQDQAPVESTPLVASSETGPRPVLVTGTPAPVVSARHSGGGPSENWAIGGIIAAIVAGALWMHSGMTLRSFGRRTPSAPEIDT